MKKTLMLAAALVLLAVPALAQDVVSEVPATWWSELVASVTSALEPIAITVLTALGGYVLTRVSSWLKGKISDQARNRILSGAAIAGNVALQQLISSSRDGKITMMELMTAVRAGAAELMKTYSESAAKLDMTVANAERVVKDGIMNAAAQQGLTVDLNQAGTMFVLPPAPAVVASSAPPAPIVPGPGMMRSHPVATGIAFAAALAVVFLLVG